jgi:CRISPR-associated protein Cmr3
MSKRRKKQRNPTVNPAKKARMQHQEEPQDKQPPNPRLQPVAAVPTTSAMQSVEIVRSPPPTPSEVLTLLPTAPLICRSGRPFDDQAGPDQARFPPPSTVAGALRTAWARQQAGAGRPSFTPELMKIGIKGPLLARPAATGDLCLYAPRPADAHHFGRGETACCMRAEPRPFDAACGADLPDGLLPVQLAQAPDGKETRGPDWWAWDDLLDFRRGEEMAHGRLSEGGWSPHAGDRRTHVAIDRETLAAKRGQLFQTEGLDFGPPDGIADLPTGDLRLLVRTGRPMGAAMAHLGGERRLARIEPRTDGHWPEPPADWMQQMRRGKGLVLTLLTPALFAEGYRPGWLNEPVGAGDAQRWAGSPPGLAGLRLELRAAALGRWQPHSGWDLEQQRPRAGRKLVPAGAVYWFSLLGDADEDLLSALWLASLCDHAQDRLDGFGLALPAPWDPAATGAHSDQPATTTNR